MYCVLLIHKRLCYTTFMLKVVLGRISSRMKFNSCSTVRLFKKFLLWKHTTYHLYSFRMVKILNVYNSCTIEL